MSGVLLDVQQLLAEAYWELRDADAGPRYARALKAIALAHELVAEEPVIVETTGVPIKDRSR